jgi:hypothetical protein
MLLYFERYILSTCCCCTPQGISNLQGQDIASWSVQSSNTAQTPGLKRGFLLKGQKPKSILKKTSTVGDTSATVRQHGPVISRKLAKKEGPTPAEQAAFSGLVVEHTAAQAAEHTNRVDDDQRDGVEHRRQASQRSATDQGHLPLEYPERLFNQAQPPQSRPVSKFKAKLLQNREAEQ